MFTFEKIFSAKTRNLYGNVMKSKAFMPTTTGRQAENTKIKPQRQRGHFGRMVCWAVNAESFGKADF